MDLCAAEQWTDDVLIPAAEAFRDSYNELIPLVAYAFTNQVHVAMGFPLSQDGWTEWLADNIGDVLAGMKGVERVAAIRSLAEAGMATRPIAATLGVGKDTVARELKKSPVANATPAKGADGKTYTKPKPKPKPEPKPESKLVMLLPSLHSAMLEMGEYWPDKRQLGAGVVHALSLAMDTAKALDYQIECVLEGDCPDDDYDKAPPIPALAAEWIKNLDFRLAQIQRLREQLKVWAGE